MADKKSIDLSGFDEEVKQEPSKSKLDLSGFDAEHQAASQILDPSSTLGAVERGAKKGILIEDRLSALAGALGAKSGGDTRPFGDVYNEILPEVRKDIAASNEVAETEHPIATFGGEMLGTSLIPLPGGSLAKGAAKIGEVATEQGLKEAAKAGFMQGVKQIPQMATLGAATGAAQTQDLTNLPDLATNASLGAAVGTLTAPLGGALAEAGGAALKPAGTFALKGLETAEELLPKAISDKTKNFRLNATPGINNLTQEGRAALKRQVSEEATAASGKIAEYQVARQQEFAQKLANIANDINNTVEVGSKKDRQTFVNNQLKEAKDAFDNILAEGKQAGETIGNIRSAINDETSAVSQGFKNLEDAINSDPNLKDSDQAQKLLGDLKKKFGSETKKIKVTKTELNKSGELSGMKEKISTTGGLEPELYKGAHPEDLQQAIPNLEQTRKTVDISQQAPFEKAQTSTVYEGSIPGEIPETTGPGQYNEFLNELGQESENKGYSEPLRRQLSLARKGTEALGTEQLIPEESKAAYSSAKDTYSKYKTFLQNQGIKDKSELSDTLLKNLTSISNEVDPALQKNKLDSFVKNISNINPTLGKNIEQKFLELNTNLASVPSATPTSKIASFLEKGLPEAETSPSGLIQKQEIFNPYEKYAGKETSEQTQKTAKELAQNLKASKDIVTSTEPSKIISSLQGTRSSNPNAQEAIDTFLDNLKQASPELAKDFISKNKPAIDALNIAQRTDNHAGVFSLASSLGTKLAGMAGQATKVVTAPARAILKGANTAVKTATQKLEDSSVFNESRFPALLKANDQLRKKGLNGIINTGKDIVTSDPVTKAATLFNASQIPGIRREMNSGE